ncbi:precorrin-2 dehydrogenase/sirohydrochlorin ferrochelatase family protein [Priestia abyssalis]|uniref:precorrin-2 dehydrogenase/sirohydrochlorin ferrochelatase family protein n=1 Tax=Priestia abyssalis TaxID=1221450 RepID=UPI000995B7F6|nr:NAD(P)-dependent oxidoreductase [Priestia abyssalis]
MYPVMLNLTSQKVLVVGGGEIATRKLSSLIDTGASILVISLGFTDRIMRWAEEGKVELKEKPIEKEDIAGFFFIIAATHSPDINHRVAQWASPQQLINVVDKKEKGNVVIPSHIKRGDLSITISTNGASPVLTKAIKRELSEKYDESFGEFVSFLKECREIINSSSLEKKVKLQLLRECVHSSYLEQPELRRVFFKKVEQLKG